MSEPIPQSAADLHPHQVFMLRMARAVRQNDKDTLIATTAQGIDDFGVGAFKSLLDMLTLALEVEYIPVLLRFLTSRECIEAMVGTFEGDLPLYEEVVNGMIQTISGVLLQQGFQMGKDFSYGVSDDGSTPCLFLTQAAYEGARDHCHVAQWKNCLPFFHVISKAGV